MASTDELIARLRERAMDPERRTSAPPNAVAGPGGLLDLGGLMRSAGDLGALLGQLRGTHGDPDRTRRVASEMERVMGGIPAAKPRPLSERASPDAVTAAERALGRPLPPFVRRLYLEIADGGFGPGAGLLPLSEVIRQYRELRREPPGPPGLPWPETLVPLVEESGSYECVDAAEGRVVSFDGEELLEHWDPDEPDDEAGRRGWDACFVETAPSVEVWLERWLGSPTVAERMAAALPATPQAAKAMHLRNLREAAARYERLSVDERRREISDEVWESIQRQLREG